MALRTRKRSSYGYLAFIGLCSFLIVFGASRVLAFSYTFTGPLSPGSKGEAVTALQTALTQISGYTGPITGYFGPLTQAAVKVFQSTYNLPSVGYVGPLTRGVLNAVLIAQTSAPNSSPPSVPASISSMPADQSVSVSDTTVTQPASIVQSVSGIKKNAKSSTVGTTGTSSVAVSITPVLTPTSAVSSGLQWGAYVGDGPSNLSSFETLTGKKTSILATFSGWSDSFPSTYAQSVGAAGKTLVVYWEPSFGYDTIISGSEDSYITQFAAGAKSYGYPVILVPFDEMNLNEEDWGYGQNGNTAQKFVTAWKHIHDLFASDSNVKFGIAYNNVSVPNVSGNQFSDYYPGDAYVDYVGVDGFNFGTPWQTFAQLFDAPIAALQQYHKPIYIFSMGSVPGPQKAAWILDGLGTHIHTYQNVAGWIWFNQNGSDGDWLVNSDTASLAAFQSVLP